MEGAETPATASSTLVENQQTGSRKLRSQAGAELGLQERSLLSAASADRAAGQLAAGEAFYSCSPGDFQGCGVLAADFPTCGNSMADRKDDELRKIG